MDLIATAQRAPELGETVIGKGAVIGGNAFITSSIAPGARVSIKNQELTIKE